jgi:hypothetical protein
MFLDATSFVCLMSLGLLLLVSLNIDSGSLASWAESLISDTSRFHVLSKILLDPLEKKKNLEHQQPIVCQIKDDAAGFLRYFLSASYIGDDVSLMSSPEKSPQQKNKGAIPLPEK